MTGLSGTSAKPKVALVFCAHHKPWLMMGSLISVAAQDVADGDLVVLYNVGDGRCPDRAAYREYHRIADSCGANGQLSPFDERVREVCAVQGRARVEMEFENDQALDSGAWYRFIRSGAWRSYDYALFLGEGTLLTSRQALGAVLEFAEAAGPVWITSGHEKRRLPKRLVLQYATRHPDANAQDELHDRMIRRVFEIFCRDPEFAALVEAWGQAQGQTQDHVPDIWGGSLAYRLRNAADGPEREGDGLRAGASRWLRRHRSVFPRLDEWRSRARLGERVTGAGRSPRIHVDGRLRALGEVAAWQERDGVRFHQEASPEWFGCATIQVVSRSFLERLSAKLEEFRLYDAVELPFAGTALEIIWGFMPAWLGFEKWFTDGFHRVRKHFVTYRREDDPEGVASYLNRYYAGELCVRPSGERLEIVRLSKRASHLQRVLPACYFPSPSRAASGRAVWRQAKPNAATTAGV